MSNKNKIQNLRKDSLKCNRSKGNSFSKRVHTKIYVLLIPLLFCLTFSYSLSLISFSSNSIDPQFHNSPYASGLGDNYNITLTGLSSTSAFHGDTVTLFGYAKEWDFGSTSWINSVDEEIHIVINGLPDYGVTDKTDALGQFQIEFEIKDTYDINTLLQLEANVTDTTTYQPVVWFPQYLDVNARCELEVDDSKQLPALVYDSLPYAGFTNYEMSCLLRMDDGNPYEGPSIALNLDFGAGSNPIAVDSEGNAMANIFWQPGYSQYTWSWIGTNNISAPTSVATNFRFLQNIAIDFLDTEAIAYHGYEYVIRGKVTPDNDLEFGLSGVELYVSFMGMNTTVFTNANGVFTITVPEIPATITGVTSINVTVISYNGENIESHASSLTNGLPSTSGSVEIKEPTAFDNPNALPFELIFIIIGIAAAVVGVIIFMRWRLKREAEIEKNRMMIAIGDRSSNIHYLLASGRIKEALAYIWAIYSQLVCVNYGIEKKSSETPKQLAITLVREFGQNPASIYPFIQSIEQAVYGSIPLTDEYFNDVIQNFKQLSSELMGKPLEFSI